MEDSLNILYQDEWLVAINKPSGLLVHKSPIDRHETRFAVQTLRNQLNQWVYPVHRLDKPTSGVLLFGLNSSVTTTLCESWPESVKTYWAVVRGWAPEELEIDYPLSPIVDKIADKHRRKEKPTQSAVTQIQRLATIELDATVDKYPKTRYSLVQCTLKTGRKHQIRRHMKHISHPIIGDAKYGKSKHNRFFQDRYDCHRLLLHAQQINFIHPVTQKTIRLQAPLDFTMAQLFNHFNWQAQSTELPLTVEPMEHDHETR